MIIRRRHHLPRGIAGRSRGLGTATVSAATFGTSGTFATALLRAGWSPGAAVALRLLVAAVALTLPALWQLRRSPVPMRTAWRTLLAYGLIPVASCQVCYFEAVQHLSVAVALLLEYSGTVLVVAWMWARHRQVPTRTTLAGGVVAIAGLVLVLNLAGDHHLALLGVLWGLGAAVGLAAYFVLSARAPEGQMPPLVVAGGGMWVGAAGVALAGGTGLPPLRAPHNSVLLGGAKVSWLVPLLGIGLVAAAFAYVTGIAAARALGARLASFVGLAEVLFAAVYAWWLLGERLAGLQVAGAALVLAGIVLVRLGEPEARADRATDAWPVDAAATAGAVAPAMEPGALHAA